MNNKGSDKNVANIEDDVKILEEFAEICKAGLACYDQTREGEALEHILAEREQMIAEKKKYTIRLTDEEYRKVIENAQMDTSNDTVVAHRFAVMQQQINEKDKRIQELEKERDHWHGCFIVAMENGIAKEKVKNVLKNNRNEIFSATYLSREQFRPYEMQIERINKIEQELIGEDK